MTPTLASRQERVEAVVAEHRRRLARINDDCARTVGQARAEAAGKRIAERARYRTELAAAKEVGS